MVTITNSELKEFKSCRVKHQLGYVDLLAPKVKQNYFRFGEAIHIALETYHDPALEDKKLMLALTEFSMFLNADLRRRENDPEQTLWDEDYDEFNDDLKLGLEMIHRYDQFHKTQYPFKVISLEHEFDTRLRTLTGNKSRINFAGRVDGIVEWQGHLWLLEHKTAAYINPQYLKNLELDDQINHYLWAARAIGYDVIGILYNVLAKWVPHPPKLLKNGKLSISKTQKTTYKLYLQAIKDCGFKPSDYDEILNRLSMQEDQTFLRLPIYRSASEIDRIGRELYLAARDMANPRIYRNPGSCRLMGCTFRSLCLDEGVEARDNFRKKTRKHEELKEEHDISTTDHPAKGYDF